MHASTLILSAAAVLTTGSNAAAIPRDDPHIVDFRTFGQPGCSADNQGIYTYTESQLDQCYQFPSSLDVQSIYTVDITAGCNVYVFTDSACTADKEDVPAGLDNCYDYASGLGSYNITCSG